MASPKRFDNSFAKQADRFATDANKGGASWKISDGTFPEVGKEHGYMVGGHPTAAGERYPEHIVHGPNVAAGVLGAEPETRLRGHEAAAHFTRVALATSKGGVADPTAHAGGWLENGRVVLDASSRINDREAALSLGRRRGERAIFDLNEMDDVHTGLTGENEAPPEKVVTPHSTSTTNARGTTQVRTKWKTGASVNV